MTQRVLVIGAGFAGMWSALAAARAAHLANRSDELDVVVLAPEPRLGIRPRFYESDLSEVAPSLEELFEATGVRFVAGHVDDIDEASNMVKYRSADGEPASLRYDRLILATGSELARPNIAGLNEYSFNNDTLAEARRLQKHLDGLPQRPDTPARNTVVIAGGGFTGIETAAELTSRLRQLFAEGAQTKVVVVERADVIGPELGANPRPVIETALSALGVTLKLGVGVASISANGATLSDGSFIDSETVIWTAGLKASKLTRKINAERDPQGRLHVTAELRVVGQTKIFAAGDAAYAATDDVGNHAMMSCQHAMNLGRSAGHNAAADLLGLESIPYDQVDYVTCLDLGKWGAVLTEGWDRQVKLTGLEAMKLKTQINTVWIYPPKADRDEAFSQADPTRRLV